MVIIKKTVAKRETLSTASTGLEERKKEDERSSGAKGNEPWFFIYLREQWLTTLSV
jgi:hypothetical protein